VPKRGIQYGNEILTQNYGVVNVHVLQSTVYTAQLSNFPIDFKGEDHGMQLVYLEVMFARSVEGVYYCTSLQKVQ
jgi:hypothetical protein